MFGCSFQISYLNNFSNSLIFLEKSFILTFPMAYLDFLYFFDLALFLRARAVTNPFPDLSNSTLDSEDVVSILFRPSNFSEILKNIINIQCDTLVTTLVFRNFATITVSHVHRRKQILITYDFLLPERLPSGENLINRRWCYNY